MEYLNCFGLRGIHRNALIWNNLLLKQNSNKKSNFKKCLTNNCPTFSWLKGEPFSVIYFLEFGISYFNFALKEVYSKMIQLTIDVDNSLRHHDFSCLFLWHALENVLSQNLHLCGLIPVCFHWWFSNWALSLNVLSQWLQEKAFSLSWSFSWTFKPAKWDSFKSQTLQE